jgi:hypothetical protein
MSVLRAKPTWRPALPPRAAAEAAREAEGLHAEHWQAARKAHERERTEQEAAMRATELKHMSAIGFDVSPSTLLGATSAIYTTHSTPSCMISHSRHQRSRERHSGAHRRRRRRTASQRLHEQRQ